jgi:hypothetical protein
MSARHLHVHLTTQDSLAKLASHAKLIGRVQRAYEKFLPPELNGASRVLNVKQGSVVVSASSGAVANRLRQLLPSALISLQESCGEVTEVKVKVQAFDPPRTAVRPPPRPVSARAREQVNAAAASIEPGSPLRNALQHLLDRA